MIETKAVTKNFGDLQVLKGIDLSINEKEIVSIVGKSGACLLYTSPSPRDRQKSRMPSSA